MLPTGVAIWYREKLYTSVNDIANATMKNAARYFPSTMLHSEMGRVSKSSAVPEWYSSEKLPMVMAGIRNKKSQGANSNNPSKLA